MPVRSTVQTWGEWAILGAYVGGGTLGLWAAHAARPAGVRHASIFVAVGLLLVAAALQAHRRGRGSALRSLATGLRLAGGIGVLVAGWRVWTGEGHVADAFNALLCYGAGEALRLGLQATSLAVPPRPPAPAAETRDTETV